MARVCGACCGLLLFSAMIVAGMLAGNAVPAIVVRALVGLFFGLILGSLAGWIVALVAQENVKTQEKAATDSTGAGVPPTSASITEPPTAPVRRPA